MIDLSNIKDFTINRTANGWSLFGDPVEFDTLPEIHKQQILFLDKEASKYIYDFLNSAYILTGESWDPFAKDNFKIVERFSGISLQPEAVKELKKWLFNRGIAFHTSVYVLPMYGNDPPILTTWKMVIKYCADFFSRDDITVFDNSLNWCLYFHHDNYILFGKDNVYDSTNDNKMMELMLERKKKFPKFKPPYY